MGSSNSSPSKTTTNNSRTTYSSNEYRLSIMLAGDLCVGKSNIVSRFTDNRFLSNHDPTIIEDFVIKYISRKDTKYTLMIFDLSGNESFRLITKRHGPRIMIGIIVYDITNKKSFESLSSWTDYLKMTCNAGVIMTLIGNKNDLESKREVAFNEGKQYAEKNNLLFFETSAKTGFGIDDCFHQTIDRYRSSKDVTEY
jgi:small GTP-binding protein